MAEVKIELDPVALREATTQAIMGTLTSEVRAKIIQTAISNLLSPSTDSWSDRKSPLQLAFDNAIRQTAQDAAHEMIKKDTVIQTKIKELLRQTADFVLAANPEKMAVKMAEAFVASMRKDY